MQNSKIIYHTKIIKKRLKKLLKINEEKTQNFYRPLDELKQILNTNF